MINFGCGTFLPLKDTSWVIILLPLMILDKYQYFWINTHAASHTKSSVSNFTPNYYLWWLLLHYFLLMMAVVPLPLSNLPLHWRKPIFKANHLINQLPKIIIAFHHSQWIGWHKYYSCSFVLMTCTSNTTHYDYNKHHGPKIKHDSIC